jgi:hypothetical protein
MTEPIFIPQHKGLAEALLAVQSEMPSLQKNAEAVVVTTKGTYKYKYVTLAKLMGIVLPVLNKHDLVWTTYPDRHEGDPVLRYELLHVSSGETKGGVMPLFPGPSPTPQTYGGWTSYGRRYTISALLGLVTEEDDDGKGAGRSTPATEPLLSTAQLAELKTAARGLKAQVIKTALTVRGITHGPTPAQMFAFVPPAQFAELGDALMAAER